MDEDKLNELLKPLRSKEPSSAQINQWKRSLNHLQNSSAIQGRPKKSVFWLQLACASLIGFVIGGLAFSQHKINTPHTETLVNEEINATIEYIITKTN